MHEGMLQTAFSRREKHQGKPSRITRDEEDVGKWSRTAALSVQVVNIDGPWTLPGSADGQSAALEH